MTLPFNDHFHHGNIIQSFLYSEEQHVHATCYGINVSFHKEGAEFTIVLPLKTRTFNFMEPMTAWEWLVKETALFRHELQNAGIKC